MNSSDQAVAIALRLVGHGSYQLGTGDCDTPDDAPTDCAGFAICKCYDLRRHEPINAGNPSGVATYDVQGDINTNSALGDAHGAQKFFTVAQAPYRPGDLLMCPTIRAHDAHGGLHEFIGHVVIVIDVGRYDGTYRSLDIVESKGPDGRRPGITQGDGRYFDEHDETWPLDKHRSWVLRPVAQE